MAEIPARYSPHISATDFLAEPAAGPDERIDVGVLFVGGGPAGLAGAIRLAQLLETAPDVREKLGDTPIAVVEKGKYPGAHLVSGAVVNPVGFRKLFPDLPESELPFRAPVRGEAIYYLTATRAIKAPIVPTMMKNRGNLIGSISEIARWLGERAEAAGVMMLNETTAQKLLVAGGTVRGILTGAKGLDRDGSPLPNHEPGVEIHAGATVLAEGVTGHLAMTLVEHFGIGGANPQVYALGVKEVWDVPKPLDRIIHTMGWPLAGKEFGGSFVYPLGDTQVAIGMVVGLDAADASLSVHDLLQALKLHPLVKPVLEGGTRNEKGWGAKTIAEGGFYSLPRRLAVPGALLSGECAGFVNVPALKGIHYAMWSGILAAEAIFAALKAGRDLQAGALEGYEAAVRDSFIWKELRDVRNMRQAFNHGFWPGAAMAGMMTVIRGAFPFSWRFGWRFGTRSDADHPVHKGDRVYPRPDGKLIFDKLSSVYASGNRTRDTQPNHILVRTDVPRDIGDAWIAMCPAAVYEWVRDESGKQVLKVNAPNCVQCGAITAKGGRLTPPEGGSGPEYTIT